VSVDLSYKLLSFRNVPGISITHIGRYFTLDINKLDNLIIIYIENFRTV